MNITESELSELKACQSDQQWNDVCDKVKRARGGQYPPDWYPKVILSGLLAQVRPGAGIKVSML